MSGEAVHATACIIMNIVEVAIMRRKSPSGVRVNAESALEWRPEVRSLLTSSARIEELVEQITERRLEYVHLKRP